MPYREWRLRIQDILQSIVSIQNRIQGMTLAEFREDETIIKAVFYDLIIIGEASINVPAEIQSCYPEISWRLMSDARNIMAHEYFQIRLNVVWDIITEDLPPLISQLQDLLQQEGTK